MTSTTIKKGHAQFQTEGRLLQELGERLVASPEVALVELVKNSYDADASICEIRVEDSGKGLVVLDNGTGMTFEDFEQRWMRIATAAKEATKTSKLFERRVTGQKGIGRFAVRFLGTELELQSVAHDAKRGGKTQLRATFVWPDIDRQHDLGQARIPYTLTRVDETAAIGTRLAIRQLRMEPKFVRSKEFYTQVLRIVSPIQGLEPKRFGRMTRSNGEDPGFRVLLPGGDSDDSLAFDIVKQVLDAAWAQLEIELHEKVVEYTVRFSGSPKVQRLKLPIRSYLSQGCRADIRFFPKRKGVFKGRGFNGQKAWTWVRENHGVAVIDHGFRIKPFGFPEDDWLRLDMDGAHNRRDWRSEIANKAFPLSPKEKNEPSLSPALNLPSNLQLVGAVYVESRPATLSKSGVDLVPSMDREGFLVNEAFEQLSDVVRGGIEFLASEDKRRLLEEKERIAREAVKSMRADLKSAIEYIEQSPTLTKADKARIAAHYTDLSQKVDKVEEYNQQARQKLEVMSSLGVVAGFMTHEADQATRSLERASEVLVRLARKYPQLKADSKQVEESHAAMSDLLEYTRSFVDAAHAMTPRAFKSAPQVKRIIDKFGRFASQRGISVSSEVDDRVDVPPIPVTVYSGVLLNLYTNALKAILALKEIKPSARILFRAWNDARGHNVEVHDTGIGIPPELHSRVWDPLFTTTSQLDNPLGSGMGLGLTLARQLVIGLGGRIDIVSPAEGFSTCFRVRFIGAKAHGK